MTLVPPLDRSHPEVCKVLDAIETLRTQQKPVMLSELHFIRNSQGQCLCAGVGPDGTEDFWTNDWNFGVMMTGDVAKSLITQYPRLFKGCVVH